MALTIIEFVLLAALMVMILIVFFMLYYMMQIHKESIKKQVEIKVMMDLIIKYFEKKELKEAKIAEREREKERDLAAMGMKKP